MARIKLIVERKPPPPRLEPFDCVICMETIERDPYQPEWLRPPICNHCAWHRSGRLRTRHIPFQHWNDFARLSALVATLEAEAKNVRSAH